LSSSSSFFSLILLATVFVWYGKQANPIEKGVAAKFATDYKNEIRVMANVVYVEGNTSKNDFWKALGGECNVANEVAGGDDAIVSNEIKASYKLYKFDLLFLLLLSTSRLLIDFRLNSLRHRVVAKKIDPSKLETVLVNPAGTDVTQEMLRADSCSMVLILDAQTELYLWHKKEAPELHLIYGREYVLVTSFFCPPSSLSLASLC